MSETFTGILLIEQRNVALQNYMKLKEKWREKRKRKIEKSIVKLHNVERI